jgi:hypothetical protein
MAKHKFRKPKGDMDPKEAKRLAMTKNTKTREAQTALASMGQDIPGEAKSQDVSSRMMKRYGGRNG